MRVEGLTQSDLASRTRMSQARVCQILGGNFSDGSTHARTLHSYARSLLEDPGKKSAMMYENAIQEAALDAWDYTENGAKVLLDLLKRLKLLQTKKMEKPG